MGECLITRRGGETYKLPILNASYPKDVTTTVIKGNTTSATFNVDISEPGNPAVYTYQWYVNGTPITEATSATYTMDELSETATYTVYCEVTNKKGVITSRVATLEVIQNYTPVLDSSYPQNATVVVGNSVTAKVTIKENGCPAVYTYQWYKDGKAVSGETGSSYKFTLTTAGSTSVYCEVTNSVGSVKSRTATITSNKYYVFKDGSFAESGSFNYLKDDSEDYVEVKNGLWHLYDEAKGGTCSFTTKKYNFTNRDRLYFVCSKAHKGDDGGTFYFGVSDTTTDYKFIATYSCAAYSSSSAKTFSVDVSKITGTHYIKISIIRDVYENDDIYVSQIYFG